MNQDQDQDQDQFMISLGFTEEMVPAGSHICQIFSEEEEAVDALLHFLFSALKTEERAACFSQKVNENRLREFFTARSLTYDDCNPNKDRYLFRTSDAYFQDDCFNPDSMLDALSESYRESLELGYQTFRVIGEMTREIRDVSGGDRLLEYEARVSMLLRERPITAVCQYDANEFDGATIMEVLKVHPRMIVRGTVIHNPFYIQPEEILKRTVA